MSASKNQKVVELPRKEPTDREIQEALANSARTKNIHQSAVHKLYDEYVAKGWKPICLDAGKKKLEEKGWNSEARRFSKSEFVGFNNIGVQLGEQSNGLIDIDIDDLELIEAAPLFLPTTGARFGRYYGLDKQQLAHHLYVCEDIDDNYQIKRPGNTKRMAIEIRAKDVQTVFPPSYILDKERRLDLVCWNGGIRSDSPSLEEVGRVSAETIKMRTRLLAASVYSVSQFQPGSFHIDMLAWAGMLVKAGYPIEDARISVEYIVKHSNQENLADRLAGLEDTYKKHEEGEVVSGISTFRNSNWDEKFVDWLKNLFRIKSGVESDGRPQVRVVASKETELYDDTLRAIIETRKFYSMGGQIVVVNKESNFDGSHTAKLTPLADTTSMGAWLTRELQFIQRSLDKSSQEYKDQLIKAPVSVAAELANPHTYRGDMNQLMGVNNIPLITRSGRVVEDSWGYDRELKLFMSCKYPVKRMYPDEALEILKELFCDFPFAKGNTWNDTDKPKVEKYGRYFAAAISAVLSAVVRPAMDICPMYVITSSQWSDGKSVMSNAIASAVGMEGGSPNSPLTRGGSDEEQEKQISSVLAKGKRVIVYDNHDGEFRSAALVETLTSSQPEFRVLGKSETRSIPNRSMFITNGVNIVLAGDLQTRSVMIRLARIDINNERKFKHFDLIDWAGDNSERIVSAAISLIEWALKQDNDGWRPTHRFKVWDMLVRRTIWLACGVDISPPENEDHDKEADPVQEVKHEFLEWVANRWESGLRDQKYKKYIRGSTLATEIAPESPQEAWINVISRRKWDPLERRVGYALSAIKDFPFTYNGKLYRVCTRNVDKRSMYWVDEICAEMGKNGEKSDI